MFINCSRDVVIKLRYATSIAVSRNASYTAMTRVWDNNSLGKLLKCPMIAWTCRYF